MNTTRPALLLLLAILAGALAQLQNEYYFITTLCDTPRLFDYAFESRVPSFKCSSDTCEQLANPLGTNFTRTTVCESNVQVSKSTQYMSAVPCKQSAESGDLVAAYFRITACVPFEDLSYYQLTMYDAVTDVFSIYKCPDRFCNNCVGVVTPSKYPANECKDNLFFRLYP